MKYSTNNLRKTNKKHLLLFLIPIILFGGGVYAYIALNDGDDPTNISYDPPTEEEERAAEEKKEDIIKDAEESPEDEEESQSPTNKKSASVIITDASQYDDVIEVRAFVSNHIQAGTCSYLFTRNQQTIDKSLPAHPDASTTICPTLEVNRTEFSEPGEWTVVVAYESENAEGQSKTKTIVVN